MSVNIPNKNKFLPLSAGSLNVLIPKSLHLYSLTEKYLYEILVVIAVAKQFKFNRIKK